MFILLLFSLSAYLIFAVIHRLSKNKKPLKRAFVSVVIGPVILLLINITGNISGVFVPLSELSLMTSIAGGIPGTALLVMLTLLT